MKICINLATKDYSWLALSSSMDGVFSSRLARHPFEYEFMSITNGFIMPKHWYHNFRYHRNFYYI